MKSLNEFNIKSLEELINKVQAISELPYRDIRYQYTKDKKGSVVEDGDIIIYKIQSNVSFSSLILIMTRYLLFHVETISQ